MSDLNIVGSLKVDTGNTEKDVAGVKTAINKTGEALDKTNESTGAMTGHFSKLKQSLGEMPGPLGGVTDGVGKVSGAFKMLLANPIVLLISAIVAGLALLYKAFTSTAEGADKVSFVFDGLMGVVRTVRDTILNVAGAIGKFMTGDFKGAMETGKAAVTGFGDKCVESFNRAYQASQMLDDVEDRMRDLNVQAAKGNYMLRESKNLLMDEHAGLEAKTEALKKVGDFEKDLAAKQVQAAQDVAVGLRLKYDAIHNAKNLSDAQISEIAAADAKYWEAKNEAAAKETQLIKQGKMIKAEAAAQDKTISDAASAREKQLQADRKQRETERMAMENKREEDARAQMKIDLDNARLRIKAQEEENAKAAIPKPITTIDPNLIRANTAVMADEIEKNSAKQKHDYLIELDAKTVAGRIALQESYMNAASAVADAVGQQSAVGKTISVAQALINTYQGITASLKLGMPASLPGVIAAAATGFAAVKNIIATKIPGKANGSSVSAPSMSSVVSPLTPSTGTTKLDKDSIDRVGNAAAGGVNRSYILDADYTNANERNSRLSRAARLG